uniref:hypothetical protein n=1 Tax=Orrella sp. TaxID=1921583 RepID=UPI0040484991
MGQSNHEREGYIRATLGFDQARRLRASDYTFFHDRADTDGLFIQLVCFFGLV